jgi:chemotaxis response regulator CheB
MPRAALERGFVRKVVPLSGMAAFLNALETEQRGSTWIA